MVGGRNFNLVDFSHVWIKIYSTGRDYAKEINIAIRQKKYDATLLGISYNSRCGSSSKFRLNSKSQILPFHRIGRKIKTKREYINLAIF